MHSALVLALGLLIQSSSAAFQRLPPTNGTTWHINLGALLTPGQLTKDVAVYDIDMFLNNKTGSNNIETLHSEGKYVICYFSAGSRENWRPDDAQFNGAAPGQPLKVADVGSTTWPGETWLNITYPLDPIIKNGMIGRIQFAADQGCDGIDPDNVDGYQKATDTGFPTWTQDDSILYMRFLAGEALQRNMTIGLKNSGDIVKSLTDVMYWQVNEQCAEFTECATFQDFVAHNLPVFHIEYPFSYGSTGDLKNVDKNTRTRLCTDNAETDSPGSTGFSTVLKNYDLGDDAYNCWTGFNVLTGQSLTR